MSGARIDRSRRELEAATHLAVGGFHSQAVSRAYYAAFYAAGAALEALGKRRAKHSGVLSAFAQIVKHEGLDPTIGSDLRELFDRRNHADYLFDPVRSEQAEQAISQAGDVVDAVERWLADREVSSAD